MKTLLTIFTLLFTMMIPSTSFAEWTKITDSDKGNSFYVDYTRIRKHDGYVYYWRLVDYLKPTSFGDLSTKVYLQGDCKSFRQKSLTMSVHKEPMGGGTGEVFPPKGERANWKYPTPNSVNETLLKEVCKH
jgi:hypothetical protein